MSLFVVAEVVVLLACLASCSKNGLPQPPSDAEQGRVTITWYSGSLTLSQDRYRQALIDDFEKTHPSIEVKLVYGPTNTDEQRKKLKSELSGGENGPDVYLGDVIWPAEFGHAGLALPLDRHLPADFWDRFDKSLVDAATYKDRKYAAPYFATRGLLFYRKDLLEQADLPVPKTWEQLVEQATLLKEKGLVTHGFVWQGAAYEGLTCNWMEYSADAGARVLNDAGTRSQINSPQSFKALQFMRDLVTRGVSPREVTTFQEPQAMQVFNSGQAAFLRGWNSTYIDAVAPGSSPVYGKIGVAQLPTFADQPGPGYSTIGGWSLYVNPKTKHLKEALTFIEWMTDIPAQQIIAQYSEIPTNKHVQPDPKLPAGPALVAAAGANPVIRPSHTPAYPGVSKAIYDKLHQALEGSVPPETALREADEQINGILSSIP